MKYVALLSGGKDSCYNIVHCDKNGHQLIAAASLRPEQGKEEIDSYLYQTVGQDAIEFVAQALQVPLYRRVISGGAIAQGSEYGGRRAKDLPVIRGDETEDLFDLLTLVKAAHPDVLGVSVGAILSNYQRVRVEHVCRRLGLTPLCYLWQRDQGELLAEMIEAGVDAVLIKVAGIGLTANHLGKSLGQMQMTLVKLNQMYGSHICGEGGEYETLTLDCPAFKKRIILHEIQTIIHSDNDFATVAYLRIKKAQVVPKEGSHNEVRVPFLLDELHSLVEEKATLSLGRVPNPLLDICRGCSGVLFPQLQSRKRGRWVSITNVQRILDDRDLSIEEEVVECFSILQENLTQHSLELHHCSSVNVFLSAMDFFPRMNATYAQYFGISPPARACVAIDLPPPIRLRLDVIAFCEENELQRRALHVQGLSYWAPANIGPYSQAVSADELVFISGQIGLIPSSLSLPSPRSLPKETALSSQHVSRVLKAVQLNSGASWEGHPLASIYWLEEAGDIVHVKQAHQVLQSPAGPTLFVAVKSLPKGAIVEKQVLFHTGRFLSADPDDQYDFEKITPVNAHGDIQLSGNFRVSWQIVVFSGQSMSVALICGKDGVATAWNQLQTESALQEVWNKALSMRLFHTSSISDWLLPQFLEQIPCTPIACKRISTLDTDDWTYAFLIVAV